VAQQCRDEPSANSFVLEFSSRAVGLKDPSCALLPIVVRLRRDADRDHIAFGRRDRFIGR